MDHKVKYEQALERCKKEFNFNNLAYSHEEIRQKLERIFPELKESEDERVRKILIEQMERWHECALANNVVQDIKDSADAITWLEKHGERKSTDKVEPKFKVGDWIVANNDESRIFRVESIYKSFSTISNNFGNQCINNFILNEQYHLWTIQDAKDGDVLVTPNNNIFIFKGIRNHYQVFDYCGLYFDGLIVESSCVNGIFSKELPNDYKIATKEQSDLLFQKMKEAGYEWDDEKNELRKIEHNPTEDNRKISDSAWSEEDKGMMVLVAKILDKHKSDADFVLYNTPYENVVKWLKSLKNRV